jgi:hypothetical protein
LCRRYLGFKKFALGISGRVGGRLTGLLEPAEARRVEQEIAADVARQLGEFADVVSAARE